MAASRDRLANSLLFGYALATLKGRLLRCNDTFAQLFGYADRQEALARSTGGPFPPIAGREGLDARLLAERSIPQVESVFQRADGTPITGASSRRRLCRRPPTSPRLAASAKSSSGSSST